MGAIIIASIVIYYSLIHGLYVPVISLYVLALGGVQVTVILVLVTVLIASTCIVINYTINNNLIHGPTIYYVPVRLLLYGNSSKTIINYEFYMYLKLTNQS